MKNAASISDSGLEIVTSKKEIQYEGGVEKNLRTSPVTLMIGGEEKRDPFYPPESIALVIAGLLTQGCQSIDICIYRSPALTFNNIDPAAYYDEAEQQNHIIECLRNLGVTEDAMKCMTFVSPDEDEEVKAILQGFDAYPESNHPIVARLEELYNKNESFRNQVDKAVLASFRGKPRAYKYTLFELAMILMRKPTIKAGDIREKKYDEIVRIFREELGWELSDLERKGQQPFQVIYWNRDNTRELYNKTLQTKKLEETQRELEKKERRISQINRWLMGAVAAIVALPGLGYYLGKAKGLTDSRYAALQEMHGRDDQTYSRFEQALNAHWYNMDARISGYVDFIHQQSPLLHEGITKKLPDGLPNVLFHETISKNISRYQKQLTTEIVAPAKIFWQGRDPARFDVYEKMVSEVVFGYLEHEKFDSYEQFSQTVRGSSLLLAAQKFLMAPLVDPVRIGTIEKGEEFDQGLNAWYQIQAQEFRHDAELGREYLITHDMSGEHYVGPDSYFPDSRKTLMMLCESFYPRGMIARSYDADTVKKIHTLYHALLPILEKHQWKNFNYYGVAIDALKQSPEVIQVLGFFGFSIVHFDLASTHSFIIDWITSDGHMPIAKPSPAAQDISEKTLQWVRQYWEKEQKSLRENMSAYTPLEMAQNLEQRVSE